MALPPEKICELKQIIHNQLSQMDIQSHIRDIVSSASQQQNGLLNDEAVLTALRQRGLVENLLQQLHFDETGSTVPQDQPSKPATHYISRDDKLQNMINTKKASIDPTRRYLYLQVNGGKAFLEHLNHDSSPLPGQVTSSFTLHIFFRGQRFRSRPTPCACDPDIKEGFLLELHMDSAGEAGRMADRATMMSLCDRAHLVLVRTEPSGESSLVSSHFLEWRQVLSAPNTRCNLSIEFMGTGTENKVPVGLLEVTLELLPRIVDVTTDDVIASQVAKEKAAQAERERLFLVYAKQWWKEYLQIHPSHKDRLVKIFAQDENGSNRPVCSYIKPMRAGRLLDTPRQAARFVSLIGYEKIVALGGGDKVDQWTTMHAFLCRNKGDVEDHTVLLCCLLIGFGLDAYVCVGTKHKGAPHAWVMVIGPDGVVTFWESLTGHRYNHQVIQPDDPPSRPQPRPAYPYKTVGCLFNHDSFYANSQSSDQVELSVFDLADESRWKAMSSDAVRSVCKQGNMPTWPTLPPLLPSTLDPALVSNDLEHELRSLIYEHRRDNGLATTWDEHLSYLLTPALAAYETERITGVTAGNEEFQQAIRRAVPDGHTFKGYPIQFVHRNARKALSSCLKSPVCQEIVNCRGDHVRLSVRVRVYVYPESACATWIMLACRYKSVA